MDAINQINQGSLPPSITGGIIPPVQQPNQAAGITIPPDMMKDPRVTAAVQATQGETQQNDQKKAILQQKIEEDKVNEADYKKASSDLQQKMQQGPDKVPVPENTAKHIDPQKMSDMYSSFMTLGALAGLLSRTPMTAALNNMTAAMKGVHDGDEEQFKTATDEFDKNFKKAMEINKSKLEEYKQSMENGRFSLSEKLESIKQSALKYNDMLMLADLSTQDPKHVLSALDASVKSHEHATDQAQEWEKFKITQNNEFARQKIALAAENARAANATHTGTLQYKLGELENLKKSGSITDQEYSSRRKGLIEGMAGPRIGEEKSFGQATPLILANQEIDGLMKKGVTMPALADLHVDGDGVVSAVTRLGVRRDLTDEEQQLLSAGRLYAESAGHLSSGARLTKPAFDRIITEFVPMANDKPGNIELKKAHRDALENSARVMSGKLGSQLMPHDNSSGTSSFATENEAEAAAKAGTLKPGTRVTIGGQTGTWQ